MFYFQKVPLMSSLMCLTLLSVSFTKWLNLQMEIEMDRKAIKMGAWNVRKQSTMLPWYLGLHPALWITRCHHLLALKTLNINNNRNINWYNDACIKNSHVFTKNNLFSICILHVKTTTTTTDSMYSTTTFWNTLIEFHIE